MPSCWAIKATVTTDSFLDYKVLLLHYEASFPLFKEPGTAVSEMANQPVTWHCMNVLAETA